MQTLYTFLKEVGAPEGLCEAILHRIAAAQRRSARIQFTVTTALAVLSGAGLLAALSYAAQEFYASGFYDYLSLLVSDRGAILSLWKSFGFLLLESLPSFAIMGVLLCGGVFVWSLFRMPRNARNAFIPLSA